MKSRRGSRGRLAARRGRGWPGASSLPGERVLEPETEIAEPGAGPGMERSLDRWFVPTALGIVLLAAALRLPELAVNPFHHDEGINGFFTTRLVRENIYVYDPANYHGPALYYFALVSEFLFGLSTEAMRLVTVVFGVLAVALVLPLRRDLGSVTVLVAALLLAISPGMTYVSRYFIHEMLLVCFSIGLLTSGLSFLGGRRPGHLVAAAVFAALLFTTKETAIVTVLVWVIAGVLAHVYVMLRGPGRSNPWMMETRSRGGLPLGIRPRSGAATPKSIWVDGVEYRPAAPSPVDARSAAQASGRPTSPVQAPSRVLPSPLQLAGAAGVFGVIWVLLYTSMLTNMDGLGASLETFVSWSGRVAATQVQPVTKYLEWMLAADAPILLLGLAGGLLVAFRAADRRSVFIGLWALGMTMAYSIIPYKTPWITINLLLPLALLAGILVRDLVIRRGTRLMAVLLLGASVTVSGYQAIDLSYNHYDDETYPYVFVHTSRQMLTMLDEVEAAAQQAEGPETGIVIFSPDYWPLPWYLRDNPRAGFYGQIVDTREPIVIVKTAQEDQLPAGFTDAYARQDEYTLRPGVQLVLYLRRETYGL